MRAVRNTNIGHREPEFSQLLLESAAMLKPVVGISSADSSYRIAFITGSGTAANEAVLASVGAIGPTLVISNGEFGERLLATARRHNRDVRELRFAWQEAIDLEKVAEELERRQYHLVVVVHHETSTGMLNPIAAIARLAHRHGALIAVDAISSIGAEVIAAEEWGIDVLTGASGKALSAMPGVGIVVVKGSVLEQSASMPAGPQYLNLHTHCGYMRDHAQTPNTPAVHVFVSLHASLEESTLQGVVRARGVIHARAVFARERLTQMGLEYADYPGTNSSVLTCVLLPEYLSFEHLARHLKTRGIVVYNGKGALTDRMFQIGHIGALRKNDTRDALRQVQAVMRQGTQATARPLQFVATERSTRSIS
jgi:2-aminoethylphosphonate-pyruvate transaminase